MNLNLFLIPRHNVLLIFFFEDILYTWILFWKSFLYSLNTIIYHSRLRYKSTFQFLLKYFLKDNLNIFNFSFMFIESPFPSAMLS